jgi:hypothetical protein
MNRKELIKKVFQTLHLNAIERRDLVEIYEGEVYEFISNYFKENSIYPPMASVWVKNNPVYEGYLIQKENNLKFSVVVQRHYANNPYQLAETKKVDFPDLNSAIKFFVEHEWKYIIDGIKIVRIDE